MEFPFKLRVVNEFDVVGFGTNAVDFLIQVPAYPEFNTKVRLDEYVQAAGGEVATTMAGLQRLGAKTAYIGRFGDDAAGEIGLQSLREEGVDVSLAETIPGAATQIAFIVIDARNGERTVIWNRDARLAYSAAEAPVSVVDKARVLHFTPHDAAACLVLAKRARSEGVVVSADIDSVFDGAEELFGYVDVFIASSDLPAKLFGTIEAKDALLAINKRFGCPIVGLTLGTSGSLIYCNGAFVESPGFAVPGGCKDTTGAGDSFRVGFLHGFLNGKTVEESCTMANAVAALKCRAIGARTALPTTDELDDLIEGKQFTRDSR